jgi:glycogen(starch) synthase
VSVLLVPVRYAPSIGGIETLLEQTVPLLRDHGHELVVLTGSDDGRESFDRVDGVPVYRFPFLEVLKSRDPARLLRVGRSVRELELEHGVHLRHVHGLEYNLWFVLRRHQQAPLPLVVSAHGTLEAPNPYSPITYDALRSADAVTAVSDGVEESLTTTVPELVGRVRVIRNGVAMDRRPTEWPACGSVLVAGRLDPPKGFDIAIRAFARLRRTRPDLRLRIAGGGADGARLRAVAEQVGVADQVDFLGPLTQAQVWEAIDQAAVVAVPSLFLEGFSLVALEAAMLARPVVATRVGGLPETVIDGVTGVLVDPGDPDALSAAVDGLLRDPDSARAMGASARRLAARFDLAECAKGYSELYRGLEAPAPLVTVSQAGRS